MGKIPDDLWPRSRSPKGHRGQKGHFHEKSFNSPTLGSMMTRFKYMNKLETLYKSYTLKNHQRSFEVTRGQKVKNHEKSIIPPYKTAWPWNYSICISVWPSIYGMGQRSIRGHLRSQGSKGHFNENVNKSTIQRSMTMKLMHMHQLNTLYLWCGSKVNQRSFEVTGSKRSKNFKNFYFQT